MILVDLKWIFTYLIGLCIQIFTNFLSSIMIHATRPFVLNEWIQTKIEGYEVSGTVEVCPFLLHLIVKQENREY